LAPCHAVHALDLRLFWHGTYEAKSVRDHFLNINTEAENGQQVILTNARSKDSSPNHP
jgi:hypothetical protein